ncbi:MAG: carbohydrate-binding domain-containing protein, partial [Bacteroidota bacterium]
MMKRLKQIASVIALAGSLITLADPPEAPNGKKWAKIENMSDEFDCDSLDPIKWSVNSTGWKGRPPGRFLNNNFEVSGGDLQLIASVLEEPFPVENAQPNDLFKNWTHGGVLVTSNDKATYGYFETRMKANKTFMSSTFWLINSRGEGKNCDKRVTELDITETVGWNSGNRNNVFNTMGQMNSNTHSRQTSCEDTPVGSKGGKTNLGGANAFENYHTYGVWWKSKDELLFYLDNEYQYSITPPADFDLAMYLRLVVETYNWNPPNPGDDGMDGTLADRTTYYDWTRSWKLVDEDATIAVGQTPFCGQAGTIPGTIEAEAFDNGGQDVAYHDMDLVNKGSDVNRINESVDMTTRDGGVIVGWTKNGEWLEYTVDVESGIYDMEARIATTSIGKSVAVSLDGTKLGTFDLPNTESWSVFQTLLIPNVTIEGGEGKTLRIEFIGGSANLNWVRFSPADVSPLVGSTLSFENQGSFEYISTLDTNSMSTEPFTGNTELFEIVDAGNWLVALKGSNGKYVSSESGLKEITCFRNEIGSSEKFEMVDFGNDTYALKGNNGLYLRENMLCTSRGTSNWQKWKVTPQNRARRTEN